MKDKLCSLCDFCECINIHDNNLCCGSKLWEDMCLKNHKNCSCYIVIHGVKCFGNRENCLIFNGLKPDKYFSHGV